MPTDYDAIIIGSGAGGGTMAWQLAESGKRVLLIERGQHFTDRRIFQDEAEMLIHMRAFDDREFNVNGRDTRLYIGGILGGGTSLYGAALLRPSRADFHPGRYYGEYIPGAIRNWPVTYDELKPFYDRAEELMGIAGDPETIPPHVERPEHGYPVPSPPLEPVNIRLREGIRKAGYTPYHLPLGINFSTCLRCSTCPGFYCPNGSRSSSFSRLLRSTEGTQNLTIRTECEAEKLLFAPDGRARGVSIRSRRDGTTETLAADIFILSAGAIGSPALLMKSGYVDRSNQLGKNYMYHCGALVAGIFRHPTGGGEGFIKQLGFTDLYQGTRDFPHKLGYVQTLPVPGPLTVQQSAPAPIPRRIAQFLSRRMLVISGAVEDLPQESNRVEIRRDGKISLTHRFHPYDVFRSRWYLKRLKEVMRSTGTQFMLGGTGDRDDRHTAHQVGTARFGDDPDTSVLNRDCRLHGSDNVYVVDGSFMPTSLGVGPALTIMANALRVGSSIIGTDRHLRPSTHQQTERTIRTA